MEVSQVMAGQRDTKVLMYCISGSNSYGTNLPTSDIDHRGLFYYSTQIPENFPLSIAA